MKNKIETIPSRVLKRVKKLQLEIHKISDKVDQIIDFNELPVRLADASKFIKGNPGRKISTSLLQRRYKIGFSRAIKTMDELRKKKLIK